MRDRTRGQSDLLAFFKLAEKSNMLLNQSKFIVIHYRKEDALKLPFALPTGYTLISSNNTREL